MSQRALPIFAATLAGVVTGAGLMWLAIGERTPQTIIVETRGEPALPAVEPAGAPAPQPAAPAPRGATTSMVLQNVAVGQTVIAPAPDAEPRTERQPAAGAPGMFRMRELSSVQTVALRGTQVGIVTPPGAAPGKLLGGHASTSIDDALSYALEASDPYLKEGFTLREDYWGGDLPARQSKALAHQLFKGNEYWFWMGTSDPDAKPRVAVYDADGELVSAETWERRHKSACRVVPQKTGKYYLVVEFAQVSHPVIASGEARAFWALAYGFR